MRLAKTLFASFLFLSTALPTPAGQDSRPKAKVMKLARQATQIAQAKGFGKNSGGNQARKFSNRPGSLLFIYYPDEQWLKHSIFLAK